MKTLALLVALLALPAMGRADGCHISDVVPIVSNWTAVAAPGLIVIDAKLEQGRGWPPAEKYSGDGNVGWYMSLWVGVAYVHMDPLDLSLATGWVTLTDSTFHAEVPYAAGTYDYFACVFGSIGAEPQICSCPYGIEGVLVVPPPDPTPARRASWGSVKAIWR